MVEAAMPNIQQLCELARVRQEAPRVSTNTRVLSMTVFLTFPHQCSAPTPQRRKRRQDTHPPLEAL